MAPALDKLLEKRGIKDVTALSADEKETFKKWENILSSGTVTVKKIEEFCRYQIHAIETKWRADVIDNAILKNEKLVVMHTVYSAILNLIIAPQAEKEVLEKYLNQLLAE